MTMGGNDCITYTFKMVFTLSFNPYIFSQQQQLNILAF